MIIGLTFVCILSLLRTKKPEQQEAPTVAFEVGAPL